MSFQNKGFWMPREASRLTDGQSVYDNSRRIEPKRSHQWFMDGTGTELFSNKKQAIGAHDSRPVPGISRTNVPQWNSTSRFQPLSGEFSDRLFGSMPVRTVNLVDRSIPSINGGSLIVGRRDFQNLHNNSSMGLSLSHFEYPSRFNLGGIRKVKANQVRYSGTGLSASMGLSHGRGDNNSQSMGTNFDKRDNTTLSLGPNNINSNKNTIYTGHTFGKSDFSFFSMGHTLNKGKENCISGGYNYGQRNDNLSLMGQSSHKGDGNFLSIGQSSERGNGNVMPLTYDKPDSNITPVGSTQDKGYSGVLSLGHNINKGETNTMSFGGYQDEPKRYPSGNIISGYDLLMGTHDSARASREPGVLVGTQNSAPASQEPSSLIGTQNSAPASQEPSSLIGAQNSAPASKEPNFLMVTQNSAQASQEPRQLNLVEPNVDSTANNIPITNPVTVTAPKRKAAKKAPANSFPSNVKSLLSTGLLDGIPVKYVSWSREKSLKGTIKGTGYLCGCSNCNYTKVLNAYDFERHANCQTRHPNNHIYLVSGKTVYGAVQELKNAPQDKLFDAIENVTGSKINQNNYSTWKGKAETFAAAK